MPNRNEDLIRRPEDAIYRTVYAPVDLRELLASAETRSRIRRLPPVQVFFGLKELSDEEVAQLAPHISQEQWRAVIDLDIWSRDNASTSQLINLERHILLHEDAVASKLVGAPDAELWELAFARLTRIHAKVDEEVEGEPKEGDYFETPDRQYFIMLPRNPELARLLRAMLIRLYQLDPDWTRIRLESARFRTQTELNEVAYEKRTRRVEEMGFQDYYEAVEIYAPLLPGETPAVKAKREESMSTLPSPPHPPDSGALLLLQALAHLSRAHDISPLLEELFFVCNKILTADRVSPGEPRFVKRGIRKALTGISLGLDLWSKGNLERAAAGVQDLYLQFFFRLGHTRLLRLRQKAQVFAAAHEAEPGSPAAALLRGLLRRYPIRSWQREPGARLRWRFFSSARQVWKAERRLE